MKIPCCVIKDLLPLYEEKMLKIETFILVESHLSQCEECKKELEELHNASYVPTDINSAPLKHIKTVLRRKQIFTILLTVILTLAFFVVGLAYMLSPQFIPYSDDMFEYTFMSNGTVDITIKGSIADYEVSNFYSREAGGEIYYISAWDNTWNKVVSKKDNTVFTLNPNGEPVASIYYSPNDGSEDILIGGNSMFEMGGSVTLPRKWLAIPLKTAILMFVLLGALIVFFRNKSNVRIVFIRIEYIPTAYIISHILVKGFHINSYALAHDIFSILLLCVPLYFLLWIIIELLILKKHNEI